MVIFQGTLIDEEEDIVEVEARPEKRGKTLFTKTQQVGNEVFAGMRTANFQSSGASTDSTTKIGKGGVIMQMMKVIAIFYTSAN